MASSFPPNFRFGDVLRLVSPANGYEDIRVMYIGEAYDPQSEDKRIVAGIYLRDPNRPEGRSSTFYAHAYQVTDD